MLPSKVGNKKVGNQARIIHYHVTSIGNNPMTAHDAYLKWNGKLATRSRVRSRRAKKTARKIGQYSRTHAPRHVCVCLCVCVRVGVVCVCVCSSILGVGSGVKVCGKNVYYALAMAQAAKSAVNLSLLLALPLALPLSLSLCWWSLPSKGFKVRPCVTKKATTKHHSNNNRKNYNNLLNHVLKCSR